MTKDLEMPVEQRHRIALDFMKLTLEKELSGDTIKKILAILRKQDSPTQACRVTLSLTDILKGSKTEAEFLQKMKKLELQKD